MSASSSKGISHRNQSGQILIEYVLLLMIGLTIGNILVKSLTAYGDNPGVIIKRWGQIWDGIGSDYPDKKQ
ncbi:MAG: hypothetical protein RJB66_1211 [Pseudomonadota bacterium]|jgi:hypothetical protein